MNGKAEEIEFLVLKQVELEPELSQRQLARKMGISLGKVNFCIKALMKKGYIKARNFKNSDNKWAYAYNLTPQGIEEKTKLTAAFLKRKVAEYDKLKRDIEELTRENSKHLMIN